MIKPLSESRNMQLIDNLRLSLRKIKQIIPKRRKKSSVEKGLDANFVE